MLNSFTFGEKRVLVTLSQNKQNDVRFSCSIHNKKVYRLEFLLRM